MSLYGALDKTKHFDEFNDPLDSAEGVLSPTVRKNRALANLTIDGFTFDADGFPNFDLESDATSGNVEFMLFEMAMTAAGATVSGMQNTLTSEFALGNWANAINGKIDFGAAGRVTGLAGAICAEIDLGAGCTQGSYAPFEAELIMPAGALTGTRSSFMTLNLSGAAAGTFDDNGFLFDLNGVTAGAAHVFRVVDVAAAGFDAALRVQIGGTTYYIGLNTDPAFPDPNP